MGKNTGNKNQPISRYEWTAWGRRGGFRIERKHHSIFQQTTSYARKSQMFKPVTALPNIDFEKAFDSV